MKISAPSTEDSGPATAWYGSLEDRLASTFKGRHVGDGKELGERGPTLTRIYTLIPLSVEDLQQESFSFLTGRGAIRPPATERVPVVGAQPQHQQNDAGEDGETTGFLLRIRGHCRRGHSSIPSHIREVGPGIVREKGAARSS